MAERNHRQRLSDDELSVVLSPGTTDEEIEGLVASPCYWSYIVRCPTGEVAVWGRGRSRQTCERNAVKLAVEYAFEYYLRWERWPLGRWRFVLWRPRPQSKNDNG